MTDNIPRKMLSVANGCTASEPFTVLMIMDGLRLSCLAVLTVVGIVVGKREKENTGSLMAHRRSTKDKGNRYVRGKRAKS